MVNEIARDLPDIIRPIIGMNTLRNKQIKLLIQCGRVARGFYFSTDRYTRRRARGFRVYRGLIVHPYFHAASGIKHDIRGTLPPQCRRHFRITHDLDQSRNRFFLVHLRPELHHINIMQFRKTGKMPGYRQPRRVHVEHGSNLGNRA